VTILKADGVLHAPDSSPPVVLLQIQETGVGDIELVSEVSLAAAEVKAYGPGRKKRKRGPEAGLILTSDEEGGESEEDEWEEGVEDGMGATINCSALDFAN